MSVKSCICPLIYYFNPMNSSLIKLTILSCQTQSWLPLSEDSMFDADGFMRAIRTSKAARRFWAAVRYARRIELRSGFSSEDGMHLRLKVSQKSRVLITRKVDDLKGGASSHIIELVKASGCNALIKFQTIDSSQNGCFYWHLCKRNFQKFCSIFSILVSSRAPARADCNDLCDGCLSF